MHIVNLECTYNELEEKLTQFTSGKSFVSKQQQPNCFYKNDMPILKWFLMVTARNRFFLFFGLGNRNLLQYHDFLGRC